MAADVSPEDLAAFARGELSDAARAEIELHVDECSRCRVALSEACRHAASEVQVPTLPEPGEVVGRYTIGERLGEGAMGVVFAARDHELEREVAIKLLRPQVGASEDELVRQRMLREGRAIARIDHPNVVRVLDVGEWRGSFFVVMEKLDGVTLRAWLPRSRAAVRDAMLQCARGLAAAHAVDVVHRDFKPDNVIVSGDGRARVTDFGLALTEVTAVVGPATAHDVGDGDDPRITRTHGALGTPAYMAPEQRRGERVDARADQYAWAKVASEAQLGWRWRERAALQRALQANAAERFASFTELLAAFRPRRRWPWLLLLVPLVVGLVAMRGATIDPCEVSLGWNPVTTAPAAVAFAASPSPGAMNSWHYVQRSVSRYEATWHGLRIGACRDQQEPIAHCLDLRRSDLAAMLERWQRGARDALASAPQAIDALAAPERCLTPEGDASADPTSERRLASARADRLASHALVAKDALVALLATTPAPALRAEILAELAASDRDLGDTANARDHLVAAIAAAETAGASRTKLLAWVSLAELASDELIELAQANDALRFAAAILERLGNPEELARRLDVARGVVAMRAGDPRAAIADLQHSLEPGLAPTEAARRLQILARAQLEAGFIPEAHAALEQAEKLLVAALGSDSGALVAVEDSMIETLDYLGRRDDAIARGERALTLLVENYGANDRRRRKILGNLAVEYANVGKLDRAIALNTELVGLATTAYDRAVAEINLGSTLNDAGRYPEALIVLQRARDGLVKTLGEAHPLIANAETALGGTEGKLGHFELAIGHARKALAIREQTKAGPGYLAYAKYLLAQLLVQTGKRAEGLALAKGALDAPLASDGREGQLANDLKAFLAREAR